MSYKKFYANHFYFYHLGPIIIGPLIPIGLDGGIILDSIIGPNIEIITYLGLLIAPLSTAAAHQVKLYQLLFQLKLLKLLLYLLVDDFVVDLMFF